MRDVHSVCWIFLSKINRRKNPLSVYLSVVYYRDYRDAGKLLTYHGTDFLPSCRVFNKPVSRKLREKEISRIAWSFTEITKRIDAVADEAEIKALIMKAYQKK